MHTAYTFILRLATVYRLQSQASEEKVLMKAEHVLSEAIIFIKAIKAIMSLKCRRTMLDNALDCSKLLNSFIQDGRHISI
jgi:hypothetical protein